MQVGDVVTLKVPCLGNAAGAIGVCYEEYDLGEPGAGSVIFPNGNYDGFSPKEQKEMLSVVGISKLLGTYKFQNVMRLSDDFRRGMFDSVLKPGGEWK